jgi:hypothetical protein
VPPVHVCASEKASFLGGPLPLVGSGQSRIEGKKCVAGIRLYKRDLRVENTSRSPAKGNYICITAYSGPGQEPTDHYHCGLMHDRAAPATTKVFQMLSSRRVDSHTTTVEV